MIIAVVHAVHQGEIAQSLELGGGTRTLRQVITSDAYTVYQEGIAQSLEPKGGLRTSKAEN